ncbi:MAG: alpha/beta fold hydrolase [Rhodocyclaceae bacterium]|nr:MAG: alpha/beta fold hydrolase [Rhodocyclaceae bacterium]
MLARLFRLLLLFELFAYLAGGVLLVNFAGWRPGGAILLMTFLALAWRAGVILVTYLLALAHRTPVPGEQRIGVTQELLEGLREFAAFVALSGVQPFERMILGRDAPSKPPVDQVPLLLIHGYCCNRGFWWWLKPRLEARGRSVATLTLEPLFGNIDGYAEQVARRIEGLCRETGADQVMLVGHSMGGLVSRAYLRRYGEVRVARLVTLGTAHRGSVLARFGIGRNSRQMEPGNAWLRDLELSPLLVPCIVGYSTHDNFVMPGAAMLLGAENHALPGVGHLAMSISPLVLAALLEATSG